MLLPLLLALLAGVPHLVDAPSHANRRVTTAPATISSWTVNGTDTYRAGALAPVSNRDEIIGLRAEGELVDLATGADAVTPTGTPIRGASAPSPV